MLDLNHPETKYTFAISGQDDAILSIAKRMTLVDTAAKKLLLPRAHEATSKMRQICIAGWGKRQGKLEAIDLLHLQIAELAATPSLNNYVTDWQDKVCTVCQSSITNLENYKDMCYCQKCLELIAGGRHAVNVAFALWCI
ncbi:MAG: hypothetical protein ABWY06_13530 [Pseudomonas sp.]|uniref:hypothetical protein n=1 Tax=Pseudomonas sp. TaxID=306 RepID=UPI00339AD027